MRGRALAAIANGKAEMVHHFASFFLTIQVNNDDGAVDDHLPAHRATQPFRQAPPLHPMVALPPWMNMLARRCVSGPPTPPTAPTRSSTTMEEMGGFSPIIALLVNLHTPSSSSRPAPDRIRLSATGFAGNKTTGGWFIPKFAISQHDEIIAISAQMALDGPTSSKATRQHQCEPKQQSTGL